MKLWNNTDRIKSFCIGGLYGASMYIGVNTAIFGSVAYLATGNTLHTMTNVIDGFMHSLSFKKPPPEIIKKIKLYPLLCGTGRTTLAFALVGAVYNVISNEIFYRNIENIYEKQRLYE